MLNPNIQAAPLPPFLTPEPGLQSGYMILQYTAADLVSTNRSIGRPSVDNIPVSGNQEDHVSMSAQSALAARRAVENTLGVVGIELVCGAQALDFFDDLTPGVGTTVAYESVRSEVEGLDEDRPLHRDIDAARELIRSGELGDRVESVVGEPLD